MSAGASPRTAWSYWSQYDEVGHPISASFFAFQSATTPHRYHLVLYLGTTPREAEDDPVRRS